MKSFRRWLAAVLAAAAVCTASVSYTLALPAETPFADLRIDASDLDIPERSISVNLYHRDENGQFQPDSIREYTCKLNRATRDAAFFIQANTDHVWVSVDYLTDINGDGIYEMLEDLENPVWDVMDPQGVLTQHQPGADIPVLTGGQPYILSPEMLTHRSQQAIQSRMTGGSCALDVGQGSIDRQEFPLCMVRLHHTDPAGGQDYEQTYYLQIYDNVLIPVDVSPSDWYYDAVGFVLSRGYFSGASSGLFLPNGQLSRAQLAQVLWAMSGSPKAQDTQFSDVASTDWFYKAVSWCQQEGLIAGYSSGIFAPNALLSREQMATILYRYAQYDGVSLLASADLSQFSDGADTALWAAESMRWAVTHDIISTFDNALHPGAIVSRAELAAALYSYELNLKVYR